MNLLDLNKFSLAGLRLVDTAASMNDMRFTPDTDTLFFVAGDLKSKGNDKYRASFLKGLAAAYPGAHPVTIVNCPCIGNVSGRLIKTTVSKFGGVFAKVDNVSTILVPACYRENKLEFRGCGPSSLNLILNTPFSKPVEIILNPPISPVEATCVPMHGHAS